MKNEKEYQQRIIELIHETIKYKTEIYELKELLQEYKHQLLFDN